MASNFPSEWHHCEYCGAGFLTEDDLLLHKDECSLRQITTSHIRDFQRESYLCSYCGESYLTQEEVENHETDCRCVERTGGEAEAALEDASVILVGEEVNADNFQTSCYGQPDEREKWPKCPLGCDLVFTHDELLLTHMESAHFSQPDWRGGADTEDTNEDNSQPAPPPKKPLTCQFCKEQFENRKVLDRHRRREHMQRDNLQDVPWDQANNPFASMPNGEAVEDVYVTNEAVILAPHREDPTELRRTYNFPVNQAVSDEDIERHMNFIYDRQSSSYQINMSAGVILEDEDGELRFFSAGTNMMLLHPALYINSRRALRHAISKLQEMNIYDLIMHLRISSKVQVRFVTNVEYYVFPVQKYNLSAVHTRLPDYIQNSRAIVKHVPKASSFSENMCVFIALAHFYMQKDSIQEFGENVKVNYRHCINKVKQLYNKWFVYCHEHDLQQFWHKNTKEFLGIPLDEMCEVEKCFEICINVHYLNEDLTSHTCYSSCQNYSDVAHFNMYDNHVSFISNIMIYSKKFTCDVCQKMFDRFWNMKRHRVNCSLKSRHVFVGGSFKFHRTVFQQLESFGVHVPESKRYYKFILCFDMESILAPVSRNSQSPGAKLVYTHEHQPVSVSICSNIPGFQSPHTIIDSTPRSLVNCMFEHFHEIRRRQQELAKERWYPYYDQLLQKINDRLHEKLIEFPFYSPYPIDGDTGLDNEDSLQSFKSFLARDLYLTQLLKLAKKFQRYVSQCVIVGFNNGSYDNNIIRGEMMRYLCRSDENSNHDNVEDEFYAEFDYDYSDATSQEEWEEDQDVQDEIDLFSWDDHDEIAGGSPKKKSTLKQQCEHIMNSLKQAVKPGKPSFIKRVNKYLSISNGEWSILDVMNYLSPGTSYSRFLSSFGVEEKKFFFPYEKLTDVEALKGPLPDFSDSCWYSQIKGACILNGEFEAWQQGGQIGPRPATGEENYAMIQRVWKEKGFTNLADLLKFYNEIDVLPMISATRKLLSAFHELQLDALKISISLPGLARKMLYRYAEKNNCSFPLIKPTDSDWMYKIKANLVAGPAIIYQREAIRDVTAIRPGSTKLCKRVYGWDQNAMYSFCIAQHVPCYSYCRRFSHESFRPHFDRVYPSMFVWMKAMERRHNVVIHTRMNSGQELRIGRFYCDGYSLDQSGNVTIWEYNGCYIHKCIKCPAGARSNRVGAYEKTLEKVAYLENLGYRVISEWECCFIEIMRNDPDLMTEYRQYKPEFLQKKPKECTEDDILTAIRNNEIFGFVMCSVSVPAEIENRFTDFPPLFCNVDVGFEHIGEHMQAYCKEKNIKYNKPRRMLVSGLHAKNMLFSTDLLAYYMQLGLVVYDVTEVTEYCRKRPFRDFIDLAAKKRRDSNKNQKSKLMGDMYKLLCNAAYGSTLMSKSRFTHVQVVSGEKKASLCVNSKTFKNLQHLGQSFYEIESAPTRVVFDLNEIIGFQILQLAKRELLKIVYDFMYYYLDRTLFAPLLCDTDSAYIASACTTLDELVRPEMRDEFRKQYYERCGDRNFDGIILPLCCDSCKSYFRYTPGFYKIEFEGDVCVALAPKTYVACNLDKSNLKLSSKGCQKRHLLRNDPLSIFTKVLESGESYVCDNYGFRIQSSSNMICTKMFTYHQKKVAASYLYVKRQVLADGRNTIPLQLVLSPVTQNFMCLQTDAKILAPDYVMNFIYEMRDSTRIQFSTIFQAYTYMMAYENLSSYDRLSTLSDILITLKCKDLLKIQRSISTKYSWESADKLCILKSIVLQRFNQNKSECEQVLFSRPFLDIVNNSPCNITGTGLAPLDAKWRGDYKGSGRNYLGSIYEQLRTELNE